MTKMFSHSIFDHSTRYKLINTCCIGYRNKILCIGDDVYLDSMILCILRVSLGFWNMTLSTGID
jgi:hypothetical protein